MHVIQVRNINSALHEGLYLLRRYGVMEKSRNGNVLVAQTPVTTIYDRPCERVLFNARRNANPFFHLMESLWMLAGQNDLKFPHFFNSRFNEYSDDGETINGAYGYRWVNHFSINQIETACRMLRKDPTTRRCVVTMWDPRQDLGSSSKDIPCNTHIYFDCRTGVLNMTVCNRSNDIIWGAYGANVVHMSILQEFIARSIGCKVGAYYQVSNNYHLYTDVYDIDDTLLRYIDDHYGEGSVSPYPLMVVEPGLWMIDLKRFMRDPLGDTLYNDPFFHGVAVPMFTAWYHYKTRNNPAIDVNLQAIVAEDWKTACVHWMDRALARREEKQNATS